MKNKKIQENFINFRIKNRKFKNRLNVVFKRFFGAGGVT